MVAKISCGYCNRWPSSSIASQQNNEGASGKKKKLKRLCEVTGREVAINSSACRYIKPKDYFMCDYYGYKVHFLACLNRQRAKYASRFDNCSTGCRQYWKEVHPIVEEFNIKLPRRRFINRRIKTRTITRRNTTTRTIKRRAKGRELKRRKLSRTRTISRRG